MTRSAILYLPLSGRALVAQRIEHLTTDQKVGGSNPSERAHPESPGPAGSPGLSFAGPGPAAALLRPNASIAFTTARGGVSDLTVGPSSLDREGQDHATPKNDKEGHGENEVDTRRTDIKNHSATPHHIDVACLGHPPWRPSRSSRPKSPQKRALSGNTLRRPRQFRLTRTGPVARVGLRGPELIRAGRQPTTTPLCRLRSSTSGSSNHRPRSPR
jgi:hypothetical protein